MPPHSPFAGVGPGPRTLLPALACAAALSLLSACTSPTSQSGAPHLQAPHARSATEQLQRMAPGPGLHLPDPLQAAKRALAGDGDQTGIASWYGPGFHGRRTASGERFDSHDLTAAHPSYAFGTRLCVFSPKTGKSVEVRVNDRGPYAKNRIIDLSRAAAQELDMLSQGVRRVQLWKLDAEETCADHVETAGA